MLKLSDTNVPDVEAITNMNLFADNKIVIDQVLKVVENPLTPHVRVCRCGHSDYYHLNYNGKCYCKEPNNIKDHERENEILVNCTCDTFDCVIDTNLEYPIIDKEYVKGGEI